MAVINLKENLENYKISYPNDIVLNSMNVIVGSVGLNKYTGLISPAYYALYNRNKNNNIKFFSYIFHNPFFQKVCLAWEMALCIKNQRMVSSILFA